MTDVVTHNPVDPSVAPGTGSVTTGILAYALTTSIVILGVSFGILFVQPPPSTHDVKRSFADAFSSHDGGSYKTIATSGYYYDPSRRSPVAFFPLYPLLASGLIYAAEMDPVPAMLVVSHFCLLASFVSGAAYIRGRRSRSVSGVLNLTLLSMGLLPATFFFRMTYSESTFLLSCILLLLGIQRQWPLFLVALIAGLASASRPVGVGLLLPLFIYTWRTSTSHRALLARSVLVLLVGCWGLLAYAGYLHLQFGDPLAFANAQVHWGRPAHSSWEKIVALMSYKPLWEGFLRGPDTQWSVFAWELVNPTYFMGTVTLILLGSYRGWLNMYEVSLAAALLIIPYLTRAYEMNMASFARFSSVVFPIYIVLAEALIRLPLLLRIMFLCISAFFLGAFSALFAGGHLIF